MGRDKGKGKGGGRGSGRKMFIANVEELAIRDREVGELQDARARRRAGSDEEPDKEGSESDNEPQEKGESVFAFDRSTEEPKQKGLLAPTESVNPNHMKKPTEKMIKVKNMNDPVEAADPEAGFNRREREAIAAAKAKEDYMRRHMAGETEQARADLARLAIVRQRREEAAKKRAAEGRAPGMSATGIESSSDSDSDSDEDAPKKGPKATSAPAAKPAPAPVTAASAASALLQAKKKAAAAAEPEDVKEADGGPPKIKAMDIKKLNGDALKEHLKERGLDVQGQKKDLMKRLIDYEAARP